LGLESNRTFTIDGEKIAINEGIAEIGTPKYHKKKWRVKYHPEMNLINHQMMELPYWNGYGSLADYEDHNKRVQ